LSNVVVSVVESVTSVVVNEQGIEVVVAETPVTVVTGTSGPQGATVVSTSVGSTTTGAAGTSASVTNSGTSTAAVLNFTIPQGIKGDAGPQGPQGPQGIQGIQGPAGSSGATGPKGDTGAQGIQGVKGDAGDAGPQGEQGATGATGATGPQGEQGIQGIKGDKGDMGDTGATGATGAQGSSGVVSVTAPITNTGTSTAANIGIDQSGLTLAQSQITGLVTALGAKAGLTATQTFTGTQTIESASSSLRALVIKGAVSQTGTIQEWQTNASSAVASMDIGGLLRSNGVLSIQGFTFGRLLMGTTGPIMDVSTPTIPVFRVRGAASQTANLQEWQNSAGTVLSRIESTGNLVVPSTSNGLSNSQFILGSRNSGAELTMVRQTAATSNPGANLARLYFRDGTNAGTLKLVVRAGAAGAETTILDNIPQ